MWLRLVTSAASSTSSQRHAAEALQGLAQQGCPDQVLVKGGAQRLASFLCRKSRRGQQQVSKAALMQQERLLRMAFLSAGAPEDCTAAGVRITSPASVY